MRRGAASQRLVGAAVDGPRPALRALAHRWTASILHGNTVICPSAECRRFLS